jgi:hypothetical protein
MSEKFDVKFKGLKKLERLVKIYGRNRDRTSAFVAIDTTRTKTGCEWLKFGQITMLSDRNFVQFPKLPCEARIEMNIFQSSDESVGAMFFYSKTAPLYIVQAFCTPRLIRV